MAALALMTCAGFSGYALLLTVAPLWAVEGGAGTAGSGLVNGVLLLFTVLTQLLVPRALERFGWGPVLAAGLSLMSVPGMLYGLDDGLATILGLSALRGVGFGILTVTGSAAVAALVDPRRRGEAIGAYGLAIAIPNLVLLPAGPWIAATFGFGWVFALNVLPLVGIPAALRLASTLRRTTAEVVAPVDPVDDDEDVLRHLLSPILILLAVTLAGGAVVTFTPQAVDSPSIAAAGLFLMGFASAVSRWRAGVLADRYGAQRFVVPLVALTAVAMSGVAWAVARPSDIAFLVALLLLGLCYGGLQNLTLLISFAAVARRHHNRASAFWNIGFDAGTALGSVAVGVIAELTSFTTAFLICGAIAAATLPLALRRPRTVPAHDGS